MKEEILGPQAGAFLSHPLQPGPRPLAGGRTMPAVCRHPCLPAQEEGHTVAPAPALASPVVLSLPKQPLLSAISIHPIGSPSRHRHRQGERFLVFPPPALFILRSSS